LVHISSIVCEINNKKSRPHLTKIRSGLKYYYITMSVKSITYR
jgi:hypothetical protein